MTDLPDAVVEAIVKRVRWSDCEDHHELVMAVVAAYLAAAPAEERWTCFHCGESFTNRKEAERHFGKTEDFAAVEAGEYDAACIERLTQSDKELIDRVREAEVYAQRCQSSTDEVEDQLHAAQSRIAALEADIMGANEAVVALEVERDRLRALHGAVKRYLDGLEYSKGKEPGASELFKALAALAQHAPGQPSRSVGYRERCVR